MKQHRLLIWFQQTWRTLSDKRTPLWLKLATVGGALVYLISPLDVIPDPLLIFGQLDDAAVIAVMLTLLHRFAPRAVREEVATPRTPKIVVNTAEQSG